MKYDVIVIGIGGMGSATLYQLARRKAKVLGLEQFDIPHEFGSSHGINRIIRLAYYEGTNYVPLLHRAYELWRQLELASGERLLIITGSVDAGTVDSRIITGSLASCEKHHLEHELMDAYLLNRRHPGYRFSKNIVAVYQPDGGFLMSERCIVAHVEGAQTLGAEVRAREKVLNWKIQKKGVCVNTDRASYHARKLVITAGPWSANLLPQLQKKAVPERQVLIWTQPLRPDFFQPSVFPVFNMEVPEGRFYGFPVYGIPGFKIGKYHHLGQTLEHPGRMDRDIHPEDEEVLRAAIQRYFPDANGPTMAMKTCLFTNTEDEHFILDFHPDSANVCMAAGFSGHGYKFCSVVGEIMTDLALEGGTRHEISEFRLQRFDEKDSSSSELRPS